MNKLSKFFVNNSMKETYPSTKCTSRVMENIQESTHVPYFRASPMRCWMSRSNGKLASLNENCVLVVSACDSPSSAPHHFHCLARYPTSRWRALNFLQSWVNIPSRTSRSSENNHFPYVFCRLVVSFEFHSISFAKFVQ
jgi:hypothetical protein